MVNYLESAELMDLVHLAAGGDSDAFEKLVMPHEKMMYALAYRMCGNSEDAKDCLQDSMLRIFKSLPSFRGESALSTWFYRIVTNTCLDSHRRKKVRKADSLEALSEEGWNPRDSSPGPQQMAENSSLRAALARGIKSLSPDIRSAVIMRDVQGFSYEEISDVLNVNIGTVKSRISRGREKLRSFLIESGEL